jgi:hypothetical protein
MILLFIYLFLGCLLGGYLRHYHGWEIGDCLFSILTWPVTLVYACYENHRK